MTELLLIIAGIIVGWFISRIVLSIQIIAYSSEIVNNTLDEMVTDSTILYTEKSAKYTYLYNKKTNEFICQDVDLVSALKKAYTYTKISPTSIVADDGDIIVVHKGEIVEHIRNHES